MNTDTAWRLRTGYGALALAWLLCLASLPVSAQVTGVQPAPAVAAQGSDDVALYQALLDLTSPWTVMCVAAHPDDEDGATLTVLRRKYGVHTVSLFSTFGEGGQNAIGPELYEELGAIRARETRAAAEVQGSEPYFLGLRDFGFSKSAQEAFGVWGHDEALRRMVLKIRQLRPDVIITNHDTVSGHGHHQATGRLVLEAFDAAADPRRFADQLRAGKLSAWQAQRLFVRVNYEGGTGSKTIEDEAGRSNQVVTIDPNETDPVRHLTYAQEALQALHKHASQGPWPAALPAGGAPIIRYRLARAANLVPPLPAKATTVLDGLYSPYRGILPFTPPTINGRPLYESLDQRERIIDALIHAQMAYSGAVIVLGTPWESLWRQRRDRALLVASRIQVSLVARRPDIVAGMSAPFTVTVANGGSRPLKGGEVILQWPGGRTVSHLPETIAPRETASVEAGMVTTDPGGSDITVPHAEHLYGGSPFGMEVSAQVSLALEGKPLSTGIADYLDVVPQVEIARVTPEPLVLTAETYRKPSDITLRLVNHLDTEFAGIVDTGGWTAAGMRSQSTGADVQLAPHETKELSLRLNPLPAALVPGRGATGAKLPDVPLMVYAKVVAHPSTQRAASHPARNAGRETRPVTAVRMPVFWSDAIIDPNLKVGYLKSSDDTLPAALAALGVAAKELSVEDIRSGGLGQYDTIIVDNRGYQAHPELVAANQQLLDYTRAGGTLIVCYHKANEWNPDPRKNRPQLAPYPIILGTQRVTDENSPVTFAEPQSPLLNFPNKIREEDFKGWVQERGLYYPREWDTQYRAPLSTSDPHETPLRGGLLAASYGSGHYLYTSMVWYRQLRAGIPGAYRIFANLVSYGHEVRTRTRADR